MFLILSCVTFCPISEWCLCLELTFCLLILLTCSQTCTHTTHITHSQVGRLLAELVRDPHNSLVSSNGAAGISGMGVPCTPAVPRVTGRPHNHSMGEKRACSSCLCLCCLSRWLHAVKQTPAHSFLCTHTTHTRHINTKYTQAPMHQQQKTVVQKQADVHLR